MEQSITMLEDLCLLMGIIADGCKEIGLISKEEFDIVHPKPTRHTYVRYLLLEDEEESPSKKVQGSDVKRESCVTAYLSGPLIDFLDPEITKYQRWKASHSSPSSEQDPLLYPLHNGFKGEGIKEELYKLCVKAAPLFKELVTLIKKLGR